MSTTLIKLKILEKRLGIKKTKIYDLIKSGVIPPPLKIGKASLWVSEEIDQVINKLIISRNKKNYGGLKNGV